MLISAMKRLVRTLFTMSLVGLYSALPVPSPQFPEVASPQVPEVASPTIEKDLSSEITLSEDEPLLEGDIFIDSEVVPLTEFRSGHMTRNLVADPRLLWPASTVYYQLPRDDHKFGAAVEEALAQIMAVSCVRFARRPPGQKTYLKVRVTGKGCATKVGYHEGDGVLDLHVGGTKCHTRGTIQHEFLHALGFWHEHTRPDRDDYVSVVWDNVKYGYKANFFKRSEMESLNLGLPYDYASVMHYKYTSFAKHRGTPTLVPKNKDAVKVMGQRRGVTWVDIAKLNRLYNCSDGYYKGLDLKGDGAVFGKIVETSVKEQNLTSADAMKSPPELSQSNTSTNCTSVDELSGVILTDRQTRSILEPTHPPHSRDDRRQPERKAQSNLSNRYKRETGGAKVQTSGNSEMANQPPLNVGHDNFAPQKILPELLKGVLNNDNNERPIVIQFAFYQPVIYKSENKTDNPEEGGAENKSKQLETAEKLFKGFLNQSNQNNAHSSNVERGTETNRNYNDPIRDQKKGDRDFQGYSNEHRRDDQNSQDFNKDKVRFNTDSQEYNRDSYKYKPNSSGFTVSQDRENSNSQESNRENDSYYRQHHDLVIRDKERFDSNSQEYSRDKDKYNRNSQEYTRDNHNSQSQHGIEELDLRISDRGESFHTRYDGSSAENHAAFSVGGTVSNTDSMSIPEYPDIDRRTPHDTRTDYSSSFKVSQKGVGNSKYQTDYVPTNSDATDIINRDNLSDKYLASVHKFDIKGSPPIPVKDDYITRTEDLITPIPQIKYPVDTDDHVSILKDTYIPLKKETELSDQLSKEVQQQTQSSIIKGQIRTTDSTYSISNSDISHDGYHLSESNPDQVDKKVSDNSQTQDLGSVVHFADSKIGSIQSSDVFIPSTFNKSPTKPLTEDVSERKVAKPLPAKSTEIPLDREVGPPKMNQPLIGSGDGENVAPNWKGVIVNQSPREEEPTPISLRGSDNLNTLSPIMRSDSADLKRFDGDSGSYDGTKIEVRKNRRPDIITEDGINDELDKDIRKQKLEKKLREEIMSKRQEQPTISVPIKTKSDLNIKDVIVTRRVQATTKISPTISQLPPTPSPSPPPSKRPSNPRRDVQQQEEDADILDADDDLLSKPNISRVNLNPRQAIPLSANATVKMNLRRLFRVERNR